MNVLKYEKKLASFTWEKVNSGPLNKERNKVEYEDLLIVNYCDNMVIASSLIIIIIIIIRAPFHLKGDELCNFLNTCRISTPLNTCL
jgi:hypothetical protein